MTSRRAFLAFLMGLPPAMALGVSETWKIAVIYGRKLTVYQGVMEDVLQRLRAKNPNLYVQDYDLGGESARWPLLREELLLQGPDLVFAVGSDAARAMGEGSLPCPGIYTMVVDPQIGLALDGKKGWQGGICLHPPAEVQLQAIAEVLPDVKDIGVLYHPQSSRAQLDALTAAALKTGHRIVGKEAVPGQTLSRAVTELARQVQCLLAVADSAVYTSKSTHYLLLQSMRMAKPFVGLYEGFARAGAVLSIGVDYGAVAQSTADLALDVLGEKPSKIGGTMVMQAGGHADTQSESSMYKTYLNEKTARRIGIRFSDGILENAEVLP